MHIDKKIVKLYLAVLFSWCCYKIVINTNYIIINNQYYNKNIKNLNNIFHNNKIFLHYKYNRFPSQYSYLITNTQNNITNIRHIEYEEYKSLLSNQTSSFLYGILLEMIIILSIMYTIIIIAKRYQICSRSYAMHHLCCITTMFAFIISTNFILYSIKNICHKNSDVYKSYIKHINTYGYCEDLSCPITQQQHIGIQKQNICYLNNANYINNTRNLTAYIIDKNYFYQYKELEKNIFIIIFIISIVFLVIMSYLLFFHRFNKRNIPLTIINYV